MPAPDPYPFLSADLRAGSIDSGAALMIAEVVLEALAELPGGVDLITAALARKARAVAAETGQTGDSRASLMVMREIVRGAISLDERAAA